MEHQTGDLYIECRLNRHEANELADFLGRFADGEGGLHIVDHLYAALAAWLGPDTTDTQRSTDHEHHPDPGTV
jgi:hypothetical protein